MTTAVARPDWRELLRDAADLALLGILVTVASAAVVTAPAALATASAALHTWQETGSWPTAREVIGRFVRAVPAALVVAAVAAAGTGLIALDIAVLAAGVVPGAQPLLVATALAAVALAGYGGLVVVEVGRAGGGGWWRAARTAAAGCRHRPLMWASASAATAVAVVLAVLVSPVVAPLVLGYLLFALHAVRARRQPRH